MADGAAVIDNRKLVYVSRGRGVAGPGRVPLSTRHDRDTTPVYHFPSVRHYQNGHNEMRHAAQRRLRARGR